MLKSSTLARKERGRESSLPLPQKRAWGGESGLYDEERRVSGRGERASRKCVPGVRRRNYERVSKFSPGESGKSRFYVKSDQTRNGKEVGRRPRL